MPRQSLALKAKKISLIAFAVLDVVLGGDFLLEFSPSSCRNSIIVLRRKCFLKAKTESQGPPSVLCIVLPTQKKMHEIWKMKPLFLA